MHNNLGGLFNHYSIVCELGWNPWEAAWFAHAYDQ